MGTIVLARLYTPSDLGLLAIFVSITSIMKVFSLLKLETLIVRSNSLGRAIINSKKVTQTVVFNFFFLLLGSLILFLSNYFFFGYEKNFLDIQFLLVVTSYTAFLGFLIVAENLLNFEKRYKDIAIIKGLGPLLFVISAIILSFFNLNDALVISQFLAGFLLLAYLYLRLKPINSFFFHGLSLRKIFRFIKLNKSTVFYLMPANLIDILGFSMPLFFLAFFYSSEISGQYSLAWRALISPAGIISAAYGMVFFKKFSSLYNKGENLSKILLESWKNLFMVSFFPVIVLSTFSPDLFTIIFGREWLLAGEFASILIFIVMFIFIASPISSAAVVLGLQSKMFFFSVINLIMRMFVLTIGFLYDDIVFGFWLWVISEFMIIFFFNLYVYKYAINK